jgi:2'-5' RNA ligase
MRAFLAFEVSEDVTARLLGTQEELRRTGADLGIVGRENIHFTVKFLGDVPDGAADEIDARINKLELSGIEVAVRGVGVFPDLQRPRVVWAGVAAEDEGRMESLSNGIIEALDGIGRPEDHEFHAHITLARVRGPRNKGSLASFVRRNAALDFGRTGIASLKLKSSVLTPSGPIYSDVREYALR